MFTICIHINHLYDFTGLFICEFFLFQMKSCFIKRNKVHVHTETDKNVHRIFLHSNNKVMIHTMI